MDEPYVFISYSSKNNLIANAVCRILEENNIACWIAPRDISPGVPWAGNIVNAIKKCSAMILIFSAESNKSSQVANEVDMAFSENKIIIPFVVEDTSMSDDLYYYLSRKHWLIAFPNYQDELQSLVEAVSIIIGFPIKKESRPHFGCIFIEFE